MKKTYYVPFGRMRETGKHPAIERTSARLTSLSLFADYECKIWPTRDRMLAEVNKTEGTSSLVYSKLEWVPLTKWFPALAVK